MCDKIIGLLLEPRIWVIYLPMKARVPGNIIDEDRVFIITGAFVLLQGWKDSNTYLYLNTELFLFVFDIWSVYEKYL